VRLRPDWRGARNPCAGLLSVVLALLALALSGGAQAAAGPTSHVFLIQNSGWMEPFYTDPASQLKPLVTELVMAATEAGDLMVLASFNQSVPNAPSPKALDAFKVNPKTERERVATALAALEPAKKPGRAAFADTDLNEAVSVAVSAALANRPGLVWLFTNNKNSPGNDQATARRNREFYGLIHHGADIKKAVAFPLHMPVQGQNYRANGLMVYVFAIHDQGVQQLDRLLASGRIQKIITETPARLKPLDRDTVTLSPRKVSNAPGVAFSMAQDGSLHADVQSDASAPSAHIVWNLENAIYPYTIASARLSARSMLAGEDKPITLASDRVTALAPGKSVPLSSVMQLPVAKLPGKWSAQAIGSAGSAYVLPGNIELELTEQKLELSQAFKQRMANLFPGDPLPDIFTPPDRIKASHAVLPIEVRVHFGIAPLLALMAAVLALLALAGAALLAFMRPRRVQLTVEGELRTLHTRVGSTQAVLDQAGLKVAELKTSLFGHRLTDLREGAQVRLGR
jgi:hypothetical protein